jgi:hypothetical protein
LRSTRNLLEARDRGVKRSDSITHHGAGRRSNFFSFYALRNLSLDIDAMVKWFGEDAAWISQDRSLTGLGGRTSSRTRSSGDFPLSARGAKRGTRFNFSSENGSFKQLMSTAFGARCTDGSNASRNIAAYFFRS